MSTPAVTIRSVEGHYRAGFVARPFQPAFGEVEARLTKLLEVRYIRARCYRPSGGHDYIIDDIEKEIRSSHFCIALVRQVLQHLTNDDITKALDNIRRTYPVAIITESLPTKRIAPNADIARGISTRVPLGSGVYLDEPPFSLRIRKTLDVPFSEVEFIGPR